MRRTVFVVLFRGVGGATQLPTKPLREALGEAGFENVSTYINSGNAIVATQHSKSEALAKIAAIVKQKFAFEKEIMLVSQTEWTKLVRNNPYPEAVEAPTTLHAFILTKEPPKQAAQALAKRAAEHERITIDGRVLYFHAPDGFGKSKLPPVIDRILGVVSTARNWNTVRKLMEMADTAAS